MPDRKTDEAIRRQAHRWSARMHGEVAAEERDEFERWRAADPRHRAAYARLEGQWDQAGRLAQTAVGRARALPRRSAIAWGSPAGYAVATAVVILGVGLGLWLRQPGVVPGKPAVASEIASRVGEIRTLRLSDGSSVMLDTDSALSVAYAPDARRVILARGRARFDVAHDPDRPFVVVAGNGTVTARGTLFDVSLVDGHVDVTLLRGVVDVSKTDQARRSAAGVVRLHPGQHTEYAASQPPALPRVAPSTESSWVSGLLSFDAERLGDALAQANRYSTAKIRVADPALDELKITGAYRVGNAAAFARTLASSLDLQVATEPDGTIVLSGPA
jgi:transmembrane sensor